MPFRLARAPFGAPEPVPIAPPRLVPEEDGSLAAYDVASGALRWRSLPHISGEGEAVWVPVADGSTVVAAGGHLVRLSGRNGDVLARLYLDGPVLAAWPDPADAERLAVLVASKADLGLVRRLAIRDGKVEGPVFQSDSALTLFATRAAAERLRDQIVADAVRALAPDRPPAGDPRVRARLLDGLRSASQRDRSNPDLLLLLLQVTEVPEARRELAGRLAAFADLLPLDGVRVGTKLEQEGFREAATTLYRRAAADFLARQGNADLNLHLTGSPGFLLRRLGKDLAKKGDLSRALELVELGRGFSSYLEGDYRFYRDYVEWLRRAGRTEDAARIAPRIDEARAAGGTLLLPARYLVTPDLALFTLVLAPWVLAALLLRSFLRSRATRHADLYAAGWRSAGQRLSAFFTHPWQRLSLLFLSYASRTERLLVALVGGVLLASACLLAGSLATLGQIVALPFGLANGYTGNDVVVAEVETQVATSPRPRPAALRLLAEARRARGEAGLSRLRLIQALELERDDARARTNLAVLAEDAGEVETARADYARAAHAAGPDGAVARWNLARLAGERGGLERAAGELAHRDRLRADFFGGSRPLWALCSYEDLLDAGVGPRSLLRAALSALVYIVTSPPGQTFRTVTNINSFPLLEALTVAMDLFGYGAWLFTLLALIWLPLPVRPLARNADTAVAPARRGRRFRAARRRAAAWIGLVVPGTWDLFYGRAALGALVAFLLAISWATQQTVETGGFFTLIAAQPGSGYFPDATPDLAYPELALAGRLAGGVFYLLLALNVPWTLRQARGSFGPQR